MRFFCVADYGQEQQLGYVSLLYTSWLNPHVILLNRVILEVFTGGHYFGSDPQEVDFLSGQKRNIRKAEKRLPLTPCIYIRMLKERGVTSTTARYKRKCCEEVGMLKFRGERNKGIWQKIHRDLI